MTDVATLGVTATETGVSKVDKALMGLAASAGKADAATGRFSSAQIKYAQSTMAGWDGFNTVVAKQPALVKAAGVQMQNYGSHTANVFSQLNDIAVMLAAGQNPIQLAMQQGMQLNQVWGQMGGKVGAVGTVLRGAFMSLLNPLNLVTIGVIAGGAALVNYFTSGSEKAKTFEESLDSVYAGVDRLNAISKQYTVEGIQSIIDKYGQLDAVLKEHLNRMTEVAINEEILKNVEMINSLKDAIAGDWMTGGIDSLRSTFETTNDGARNILFLMDEIKNARTFDQQSEAISRMRVAIDNAVAGMSEVKPEALKAQNEIRKAEDAAKQLAQASQTINFTSAIASAQGLVNKLWAAVGAMSALKYGGTTSSLSQQYAQYGAGRSSAEGMIGAGHGGSTDSRGKWMDDNGFGGSAGDTGGSSKGGGGAKDPYQANLDRLVASLMTERETVEKWYADNEVILNDRRAMELLGASAHKEAMLDLERQYHEKLSKIKDDSDAYNLGSTAKLFGDLNTMAGGGYDGLLRAQKAFAAAQALVNTYLGASQALADPRLSFFAKFAAVAKVVASGMGLVNAIKGGGKASSGGGGSSAQTTAASSQPVADRVTTVSFAGDPFMVAIAESVMKQMYDASGNGRVLIKA